MIRLLAMAAWLPRVILFVSRLESRFSRLPLPACLESITPLVAGGRPRLEAGEMARVIWNVLRWNRGRFNNGCFVRSLTRYHFFRVMGHPVVFHLGVEVRDPATGGVHRPPASPGLSAPADPGPVASDPLAPADAATLGDVLASSAYTHLRSHAWLTLAGVPFLEFEPARFGGYRVLFTHPPAEASC